MNTKQTEALKLALEALEYISSHYMSLPKIGCMALAAVEEALAEQPSQQEQGDSNCQDADGCPTEMAVLQRFWRGEPIPAEHYPVWFKPAQQQEPVAWVLEWTFNGEERGRRLYDDETHCVFDAENDGGVCRPLVYGDTSPPASKPWQGLTDEEVDECYYWKDRQWTTDELVRHVEAKLREKNA